MLNLTAINNKKEQIRRTNIQELRYKILVPHNEFMKLFLVSKSDIDKNNSDSNILIRAKVKIGRDLEVEFRVTKDEIDKRVDMLKEIQEIEDINDRNQYLIRKLVDEYILFDRQSYLLYCILFDYYVNNKDIVDEDNSIIISVKQIHQLYREKTLKYYGKIDSTTLEAYEKGFEDLRKKTIFINLQKSIDNSEKNKKKYIKKFPKMYIYQNLIDYQPIKNSKKKIVSIKYTLGELGKLILESDRMSTNMPIELIRVPYKEISKFYLGMYISKMYFMNRIKGNNKSISIKCILENIMCFNTNGSPKGINKHQEITQAKQKTKLIRNFEGQLRAVLYLFEKEKIIKKYELSVDKITGRNFDKASTQLTIYF